MESVTPCNNFKGHVHVRNEITHTPLQTLPMEPVEHLACPVGSSTQTLELPVFSQIELSYPHTASRNVAPTIMPVEMPAITQQMESASPTILGEPLTTCIYQWNQLIIVPSNYKYLIELILKLTRIGHYFNCLDKYSQESPTNLKTSNPGNS